MISVYFYELSPDFSRTFRKQKGIRMHTGISHGRNLPKQSKYGLIL